MAVMRKEAVMTLSAAVVAPQQKQWLMENGPKELEKLFRAIVYHPSVPVLIADNDGETKEASIGVARLLKVPREKLLGRKVDEFAAPNKRPEVSELWRAFLERGEAKGTVELVDAEGEAHKVLIISKRDILPVRHVVTLLEPLAEETGAVIPTWVQDYALYLLETDGTVAAWYGGAERIYGHEAAECVGKSILHLHPADPLSSTQLKEELRQTARQGHVGSEGWQVKKDGSHFWANSITMALKDEHGTLFGFARVVRDFSERHDVDEKLKRKRARVRPLAELAGIVGVASGEFDKAPELNDAFLEMMGYSRADADSGEINWPELTPVEYAPLDELAHEEGLRFGACTPYEKELVRKDGNRIPVLIATAVLQLSPFRWISFVQDMRERNRFESVVEVDESDQEQFGEIVGTSAVLKRVQQQIEVVAPTDATVLILGETGTGKELVARAIHRLSPRHRLPFVTLNCAAIPTGLLESELFGYERGAFTGALSQKIGRFEMANHGTLFLDEVGDIPLDLQPKLLRALQEKSFERLGGTKTIPIDVRLVAATNRNLTEMMGDKLFRSDLYYRLKVFPITTPPLRERPEDIPVLARHFVQKYALKMGRTIESIPTETMKALANWRWPGNVRELENFIERCVILTSGASLRAPLGELRDEQPVEGGGTLEEVERDYIAKVLKESGGVVSAAAIRLGVPRTTLNALMRKLGITRYNA
jgi:formate hydrogenlyase transcriptional activator